MAQTGFYHHLGSYLLFAATILLLIADISAPVVNHLALFKVNLSNATSTYDTAVTFGSFGYCVVDTPDGDYCSSSIVGYDIVSVLEAVGATTASSASSDSSSTATSVNDIFSTSTSDSLHILTKVMVLHPVATGVLFLAFIFGAGAGFCGSFFASFVALIGSAIAVAVLIVDFVLFSITRHEINGDDNASTSASAAYGPAIWTVLAGTACAVLGMLILFLSCCSSRLHERAARQETKA